jgi:hypothetical protein
MLYPLLLLPLDEPLELALDVSVLLRPLLPLPPSLSPMGERFLVSLLRLITSSISLSGPSIVRIDRQDEDDEVGAAPLLSRASSTSRTLESSIAPDSPSAACRTLSANALTRLLPSATGLIMCDMPSCVCEDEKKRRVPHGNDEGVGVGVGWGSGARKNLLSYALRTSSMAASTLALRAASAARSFFLSMIGGGGLQRGCNGNLGS